MSQQQYQGSNGTIQGNSKGPASRAPAPAPTRASPSRPERFDAMYKIVLVGDAGVGKTNILGEHLSFHAKELFTC